MNPWQFLIPDNPVALGVLGFLALLFIAWLLFLIWEWFRLRSNKKGIRDSEAVGILENVLKQQIALRRTKASVIDITQVGLTEKQEESSVAIALEDFFTTAGIKRGSTIRAHIRAIFEAGWNNSQLQIEPLIKNTARRLFSRNGLLRSILSLFIIVGLLGTLFGLAHSLSELLPLMPDGTQLTNTVAAQGLGKILTRLRGAFAPSIWGVGLTIIGVLIFSFYLKSCESVIDQLEHLTLTVWVPRLYPNPFQQQLITLIETEDLIRQNRAHIQSVASFASHIKEDVEGFGTEIRNARTTIANLNESSSQINEFAVVFAESVGKLTPFQEELGRLYGKMMHDSKVFQDGVTQSLIDTSKVQRDARDTVFRQSEQLEKVIGRLHSYENAFVDSHQELDTILRAVMVDAQKAYQDIGQRNREIIEAVNSSLSVPLREDLTGKLTTLNEVVTTKLSSIVDRFGTFETPIKSSAQKFEQIVGTIDSRASELMARLQHEYQKQNEANVDQLKKLESLNQQLVSFIDTLTGVTFKQETSYTAL
jgi:ABC-type transporter Mla subunit MlaD/biopolymer transport protein ExbB/TolQ